MIWYDFSTFWSKILSMIKNSNLDEIFWAQVDVNLHIELLSLAIFTSNMDFSCYYLLAAGMIKMYNLQALITGYDL